MFGIMQMATELSDILGVKYPIEDGFSWTLLKRLDEDTRIISDQRLSFIMESNVKLSMAVSVLDECFVPAVDQRTGVDMICQAIYNCGYASSLSIYPRNLKNLLCLSIRSCL